MEKFLVCHKLMNYLFQPQRYKFISTSTSIWQRIIVNSAEIFHRRIPPPHLRFLLLPCFLNGFLVAGEGSERGELGGAVVHAHPGMPL